MENSGKSAALGGKEKPCTEGARCPGPEGRGAECVRAEHWGAHHLLVGIERDKKLERQELSA